MVLSQDLGVVRSTQLVQELGRTLDVGEEEGDGSGREISPAHQRGSVARRSGCVKLALNPIFIVEFCDSGNRKRAAPTLQQAQPRNDAVSSVRPYLAGADIHERVTFVNPFRVRDPT